MGTSVDIGSMALPEETGLSWGLASRPIPGQTQTGDEALVLEYPGGCLLAVVDGLGHGDEAADAAHRAMSTLRSDPEKSVLVQLRRCHEALRPTRGGVLSLAAIDFLEGTLTWAGVGNVAGVLVRAGSGAEPDKEHLLCRPGVIGDQLPRLYAGMMSFATNDTLILHSDGLEPHAVDAFTHWLQAPQRIADELMREWARATDDALVLVVRFHGGRR